MGAGILQPFLVCQPVFMATVFPIGQVSLGQSGSFSAKGREDL
jgi:hypothetical protein